MDVPKLVPSLADTSVTVHVANYEDRLILLRLMFLGVFHYDEVWMR